MVVRVFPVGVNQERRSLDIAWLVEHEQALVPVVGHLENLDPKLAPALLSLLVAQHHDLLGREIAEPFFARPGVLRDLQPGFLGRVVCGMSGRRGAEPRHNGQRQRAKQEQRSCGNACRHHESPWSMVISTQSVSQARNTLADSPLDCP